MIIPLASYAVQACHRQIKQDFTFKKLKNRREKLGKSKICFIWLGRRFLNRTFSIQEDDPIVDVDEIRELLDEEIREGDNE